MTAALRSIAIAIAMAALVDPAIPVRRAQPIPVEIRALPSPGDPDAVVARAVKSQLAGRLANAIEVSEVSPAAVVLVGGAPGSDDIPDGVPISTVSVEPRGSNVRILDARVTDVVVPGQRASVAVDIEAIDVAGQASVVVLERDGLEVARASHPWRSQRERATVTLTHAPSAAGLIPLRARVLPVKQEATEIDNVADLVVRAVGRPLRVLAWEPRPSWSTAFVRRALEADPAFDVSSVVRSSRGLDTRSGAPPAALSATGLAPFDAAIIGAPEDLTRGEVNALDVFLRDRGGAVVFLPDRLPSGAYRQLLPPPTFDEVLLDRPATVQSDDGGSFLASEFAVPSAAARAGVFPPQRSGGHRDGLSGENHTTLASIERAGGARPVVMSWPRGAGVVVFSGALDGWRFRGSVDEGFARFWTGVVASLAVGSPPSLSVSVEPAFAAPADRLIVRARYRATELAREAGKVSVPTVSATIVASDGRATPVRLWPCATAGEYEAALDAPAPGRYDVRVSGSTGAVADAPLLVEAGARSSRPAAVPAFVSEVTGGVSVHAADMRALADHLRHLARPVEHVRAHPMRSPWWIVPFASALCAEWGLRRRKGLR